MLFPHTFSFCPRCSCSLRHMLRAEQQVSLHCSFLPVHLSVSTDRLKPCISTNSLNICQVWYTSCCNSLPTHCSALQQIGVIRQIMQGVCVEYVNISVLVHKYNSLLSESCRKNTFTFLTTYKKFSWVQSLLRRQAGDRVVCLSCYSVF